MDSLKLSFMGKNDIQESARVLSVAMLNNPLHIAVFQGKGEKERIEIEKMFCALFTELPGIVFLAKEKQNILGVMRMKSCLGRKAADGSKDAKDENDLGWRKSVWHTEWGRHDPLEQHWHLGPIGVLPTHQGSGIGSILMERFCKEVDACPAKAYLETEGDKNVRFYEKFGFKIVRESEIFNVKNRYMLREKHGSMKKEFGSNYASISDVNFTAKYRASCYCNAVQYEVCSDPVDAKMCHCLACQKLHGAPMQWAAIFHKHDVRITKGIDHINFYNNELNKHERILPCKVSCALCGTLIADEGRNMWLAFPSLFNFGDESKVPTKFKPTCHIFYGMRVIDINDDLPKWVGHKNQSQRFE